MRNPFDAGRQAVILSLMVIAIARCGDSDVRIDSGGVRPFPGLFTGTTSQGGSITLEVGSIERVTFACGTATLQKIFTPPGDIDVDGTFDLRFDIDDRKFHLTGLFTTDLLVQGSIDDETNVCDVTFQACRGTGCVTPTQVATNTKTPTPIPTATPMVSLTGPTVTPVGATPTEAPTQAPTPTEEPTVTLTPTPGPTSTPFCGNGVKDAGENCDTGQAFGASDADCATQCACCYCRPNISSHFEADMVTPRMSACSGCHGMGPFAPGFGPKPPKPGAVETFGNTCN
jgi:hypothetical protein